MNITANRKTANVGKRALAGRFSATAFRQNNTISSATNSGNAMRSAGKIGLP
jgi:hypothetical protein